jgi:Epoxide hydrolase N terminus
VLIDLRRRLQNTRWSYQVEGTKWDAGADLNHLRELIAYWQDDYDWCKQGAALNEFAHFKIAVDDVGIHSSMSAEWASKPFPLILTHGYPASFYRFAKNHSDAHRSGAVRRTN